MSPDLEPVGKVRAVPAGVDAKLLATLKARCALAGVALHLTEDDRGQPLFVVSRWSLMRQLPDIDAVEAWLSRLPAQTT